MTKIRMIIEIEARELTESEAREIADLCSMEADDFIGDGIDAFEVADCLADYISDGCDEALAWSDLMVKLGKATLISAELVGSADEGGAA